MAYEQRDNTGSLFRNDRATSDRHPTHKGSALINGVDYWVSGWVKESGPNAKAPGTRFFSLAFERKDQRQDIPFGNDGRQAAQEPRGAAGSPGQGSGQGQARAASPAASCDDDGDDIPF